MRFFLSTLPIIIILMLKFNRVIPENFEEIKNISKLPKECSRTSSNQPNVKRNKISWKITGGKEARKGEFPYMVGIFGPRNKLSCGGSILTTDTVLTAAHCLFTYQEENIPKLKLAFGAHNIKFSPDSLPEIRKIKKIILHKAFDTKTYQNDIALIKLDQPLVFNTNIQPVCIPTNETMDLTNTKDLQAVATGWGQITSGVFGISPNILRKVEIPVWNLADCQKIYEKFVSGRITKGNICAGDGRRNKDACIGDSGGPLVVSSTTPSVQIGIISWGKGCGSFPGVYTNVKYYNEWILQNI